MEKTKKVSIIVPIYNAEKHLDRCINSIIVQTYSNIEIILINDGSTDRSGEICQEYTIEDKRIIYFFQKNAGPSIARNKGIEMCTGDYIQFVDSDDMIEKNMTEQLVNSIHDGVELVLSGYKMLYLDLGVEISKSNIPLKGKLVNKQEFMKIFVSLHKNGFINPLWNKLYLVHKIRNEYISFSPDIKIGEDLLFNLKYIDKCTKINIIQDVLYNYIGMEVGGSLMRTYKENFYQVQKLLYSSTKTFIIANGIPSNDDIYLMNEMYFDALIACFENIINEKNILTKKQKIDEIQLITNDESVLCIANNVNLEKNTLQNKLVASLILSSSKYKIYRFFILKGLLRKKSNALFRIIRRINWN